MKRIIKYGLPLLCILLAASCAKEMAGYPSADLLPQYESASLESEESLAIVTAKHGEGGVYLQFDDETTAAIMNRDVPEFSGEVRCMISYRLAGGVSPEPHDMLVYVYWLEAIETVDLQSGPFPADAPGSTAPLDIHADSWMTVLEDGYLTLHYTVRAGGAAGHRFWLVAGENPADPYELHLYHDPCGDAETYEEEGLVAFRLSGLPDTEGKTVPLTLRYRSLPETQETEASIRFDYKTRK